MKLTKLAALSLLAMALTATGCGDKNRKAKTANAKPVADQIQLDPAATTSDEVRNGLPDVNETVSLATVFFDLDAATLSQDAKAILDRNAEALRTNPDVMVRVEGHADERGSTQYNAALGDRRANAVKTYLNALGVSSTRMEVVSYGEEKPSDKGHDETSWTANRRVELAVTAGAGKVSSSYDSGATR